MIYRHKFTREVLLTYVALKEYARLVRYLPLFRYERDFDTFALEYLLKCRVLSPRFTQCAPNRGLQVVRSLLTLYRLYACFTAMLTSSAVFELFQVELTSVSNSSAVS